ncbi:MAG: type II toxin-antitoxin system VapC family toxin [Acidimicrobiales bacterium]
MRLLLDTHVLVWWVAEDRRLSAAQRRALERVDRDNPVLVADISLWEIATLVELERLELDMSLRDWLERATAAPLVERVGITPAVAAEVAALPATFHRDPADRIIVATARVRGATVLTKDRRIVDARVVPTV